MSRLVCADLSIGRVVRLNGVRYRIDRLRKAKSMVDLVPCEGPQGRVSLSRSELCAQIVEEQAAFEDSTEDPDLAAKQPAVNLNYLSLDRLLDWWHKMILLRHLLPYAAMSPRSNLFRQECAKARRILHWVRQASGIASNKSWSDKTLNDDLRRWRRAGYALAAFQIKGLQYRPWRNRTPQYVRARRLAEEIRLENPHWTANAVHRMVNWRLRNGIDLEETAD